MPIISIFIFNHKTTVNINFVVYCMLQIEKKYTSVINSVKCSKKVTLMKCCITLIYIYSFDILLIVFYALSVVMWCISYVCLVVFCLDYLIFCCLFVWITRLFVVRFNPRLFVWIIRFSVHCFNHSIISIICYSFNSPLVCLDHSIFWSLLKINHRAVRSTLTIFSLSIMLKFAPIRCKSSYD